MNTKVSNTKGCLRCCVGRNPYNGHKYLCAALPNSILLFQWYDPLNKFMLLKVCKHHLLNQYKYLQYNRYKYSCICRTFVSFWYLFQTNQIDVSVAPQSRKSGLCCSRYQFPQGRFCVFCIFSSFPYGQF